MLRKLKVGDVEAERGEFKKGVIRGVELINTVSIDIPVLVMNGMGEGPTILLMSTQHGTEIQGIEVIRRVMKECLDPKALRGAVIGIPIANPLAFTHHLYRSWIDNLDIYYVDADKPQGNTTERLASALWSEAFSKSDLIVNIHCNTRPSSLIYQRIDINNDTKEDLVKMARAFKVTTIVCDKPPNRYEGDASLNAPRTLSNLAAKTGTPVLILELIDGRCISEPSVSIGVKGILNIMKAYEMIEGNPETQNDILVIPGINRAAGVIRARRGGVVHIQKKPGEWISQGDVIAEIYDPWGDLIDEVRMPVNGYIWSYPLGDTLGTSGSLQAVQTGANVAFIFTHEEDSVL